MASDGTETPVDTSASSISLALSKRRVLSRVSALCTSAASGSRTLGSNERMSRASVVQIEMMICSYESPTCGGLPARHS